ncbi:bifunctional enoyl-CoA hydratase/phosphate acetyltransferase [Rickettsiales endosymbiont of Peranema trichophorum]|nr:bifunctional enoyl-CoA hydratase/phosphate acetyltransferase [Rickettsiales endosymbiont of Peranema trichophorum]
MLENKVFDEIEIGDSASLSRTLTKQDIQIFAAMTGDMNPIHLDEDYAKTDIFHKIIAHGMWGGSLFSTLLGTQLPGLGTIYLEQQLSFLKPVALGDTITATIKVLEKDSTRNTVLLECKCVNQNGKEVISGTAKVLAPKEKEKYNKASLPKIEVRTTDQASYYQTLLSKIDKSQPLKTAIVFPTEESALAGAIVSAEEGIIEPILIGPKDQINALAKEQNLNISRYQLLDVEFPREAAAKAVELARQSQVGAIMKGQIKTAELMHEVMATNTGLRIGKILSHIFVVDVLVYHKPLYITDAAINIKPTLGDKIGILQNVVELFNVVEKRKAKVAVIAAVETVTEKMQSTLDASALCKMVERGQIKGALIDGPLALDDAISKEAAEEKGIISQVAGDADVILVPDIEAGNILYKQLTNLSNFEAGGIALGAKVPIILASRSSSIETRKASCILATSYVRNQK